MGNGRLTIPRIFKFYRKTSIVFWSLYAITAVAVMALLFYLRIRTAILTPPSPEHETLSNMELAQLQSGDIILIQGILGSADIIMNICGEPVPLSHSGIIVEQEDMLFVIHTINNTLSGIDGMQIHPIEAFIERARERSLIIVRPQWKNTLQCEKTLEYVTLKLTAGVPFDNSFNFKSEETLYCTELIARALDFSDFWHSERDCSFIKSIFAFNNFLNPVYFTPVISHHPRFIAN